FRAALRRIPASGYSIDDGVSSRVHQAAAAARKAEEKDDAEAQRTQRKRRETKSTHFSHAAFVGTILLAGECGGASAKRRRARWESRRPGGDRCGNTNHCSDGFSKRSRSCR